MNWRAVIILAVMLSGVFLKGETLQKGEAQIWYLYHCGYAVKTANHFLIFDYWEPGKDVEGRGLSNGVINPEEIKDLKVRVFVTHSHVDHWDKRVMRWQKSVKDIKYFFGWKAYDNKEFYYLKYPRADYKDKDIEIYTVNSHHAGVPESAFLVKVDGISVFHGGDYQGRMAKDAPSNVLDDMRHLLRTGLEGGDHLDIMFLGAWVGGSNTTIIKELNPRIMLPMHNGGKEKKNQKFLLDCKRNGIMNKVICPWGRGDSFIYKHGRVVKNL